MGRNTFLMKVFSSLQVREIDKLTIENEPVTSINLMERASVKFTQWFTRKFDSSYPVVVFAGPGNNGGDALGISRMLIERKYQVLVYQLSTGPSLSLDCAINLERLKTYTNPIILEPGKMGEFPTIEPGAVVIDGIFGSGLNRPVEGTAAALIQHVNRNARTIVSVDIPSGLFGEDNRSNIPENIIKANFTVSFEFPFLSFFMSGNELFTGQWEVVPIGLHKDSIDNTDSLYVTINAENIRDLLIPRKKYSHKGSYGHALVIAGRTGMMGAAVLAARSCLRGGAGLTTVCVPQSGMDILQIAAPEALTLARKSDAFFDEVSDLSIYQAIACGPAIGTSVETAAALHKLIVSAKVPLVLDADALTLLSEHEEWIDQLPKGSVLTPHPKEFDRLAGASADMYSRHLKQLEFAKKHKILVVLKGANTIVSSGEGKSYINTSGNPGMATGGTGDVLTGLVTSMIAQGYSSLDATLIGVFIHGLAGDIALQTSSVESLIAGDLIDNFGSAFRQVKGQG